jgi:hypothetical protein
MSISDILKDYNKYVYDIETVKVGDAERPFAAALYKIGDTDASEVFLSVPELIKKRLNYRSQRYIAKSQLDIQKTISPLTDPIGRDKALMEILSPALSDSKGVLVGHNIRFDLKNTLNTIRPESKTLLMNRIGIKEQSHARNIIPSRVGALIQAGEGKRAYETYKSYLKISQSKGIAPILDTHILTQALLAGSAGAGGPEFNDYFSGLKLGFISEYEPFQQWKKGLGHTAKADVQFTGKYAEWLTEKALPQMEAGKFDSEVGGFLNYIKSIQDSGWQINQAKKEIAEHALQSVINQGDIRTEIKGRKRIFKGVTSGEKLYNAIGKRSTFNKLGRDEFVDTFNLFYNSFSPISSETDKAVRATKIQEAEAHIWKQFYGDEAEYLNKLRAEGKIFRPTISSVSATVEEGKKFKLPSWGKYAVGAVSLWALWNILSNPSGKDDKYNTIQGLHHGGQNQQLRRENTDFGSGWQGIFENFTKELKTYQHIAILGAIPGFFKGYNEGRDTGKINVAGMARNIALDMADDLLMLAAPTIAKAVPQFESVHQYLEHPIAKQASIGLFGYTMGKVAGEIFAKIFGKDDAYNTIEGLRHGGIAEKLRKRNTDFGSGYRGMHHTEFDESYNTAEDVYAYEQMRASALGLSSKEMYEKLTQPDKQMSPYVSASATAGTILHRIKQAEGLMSGEYVDVERFTSDPINRIAGHIDILDRYGRIGDIKTVSSGIYDTIVKGGAPKPMHVSQVNFYLGSEGLDQGFIKYINRERPSSSKTYAIEFNPALYEKDMRKLERVRRRIEAEIESGKLLKKNLPMTASLETLEKYNEDKESPEELIQQLPVLKKAFREEMAYLRTTKRGMPSGGEGLARIQAANERRKQRIENAMVSTQGIMLQAYNNRNNHHVM